ncbi:SPOR domain-containing protein [Sphingomonas naphthae]|uniref:SPOR domain-containing protein n=1 Tax=Sphingomonas naphthae TaxID=1813468 RepID=A0ABY7TQT9_9SPHN|nr:SPOR domain-containing protein [Sphingomonas naphthae]WCT74997.1 SPOR domain-containing protein [Sphingomonas naphthae]
MRRTFAPVLSGSALLTLALLAACAKKGERPETATPPPPPPAATRPVPPNGAPEKAAIPEADGKGGYRTINSDIAEGEAAWHLRSALNVAALSCDRAGTAGLAAGYNQLLARHKAALASAYKSETGGFKKPADADRHITQVYNFYAQPPAQPAFCATAGAVMKEAVAADPKAFAAFVPTAMARLQKPFDDHYRAYEAYRVALADWEAGKSRTALAAATPPAEPRIALRKAAMVPVDDRPWQIQLGAYSGDAAARTAWDKIVKRLESVARFTPVYQPVPGKTLVRVRIGPVENRDEAIAICAAAAGAALDCLPIIGAAAAR